MNYNTDGNLAALDAYLREQDELDQQDAAIEEAQEELSHNLFNAYFDDNQDVVNEVEDSLLHTDDIIDAMLDALRSNFTENGAALRTAYMKHVSDACTAIAQRFEDMGRIDDAYNHFKL